MNKKIPADEQPASETNSSGRKVRWVVDTIGSSIASGEFRPGETLPIESIMCQQLDVGRNVLREGLKILAGKGLVHTIRRAGTSVLPQSRWNMLDPDILRWILATDNLRAEMLCELAKLRRMIEPEVAALAAVNATTTEVLRLFAAYEEMERFESDAARAIEADISFHERMFEAAHSPLLSSLLRAFMVLLRANFEITVIGYSGNLIGHRLAAEAIRDRDPQAARTAMLRLLTNNEIAMTKGEEAVG
ncbi:FadR/GntR family transcriptional regulator [Castellaniella sp. WN]